MALPQRHRLRGQRLFDALYRRGRSLHGASMTLRWLEAEPALIKIDQRQDPDSPWRCGVVISSKVHKRAVQRNRLRRLLHENLRHCHWRPGLAPLWLLISLKPGSADLDRHQLLGECHHLLSKAGLLP